MTDFSHTVQLNAALAYEISAHPQNYTASQVATAALFLAAQSKTLRDAKLAKLRTLQDQLKRTHAIEQLVRINEQIIRIEYDLACDDERTRAKLLEASHEG